jgi:SAM-dependent methyltransferase
MAKRVCPWWMGYLLISPVRRWLRGQDPATIVGPYVQDGMTVLEPGPGMGYFTLELARRVGASGKVVAVDIQPKMISGLKRRAAKAGLADRIETRLAGPESLGIDDLAGRVDFTLAFALVHEMPDAAKFFAETAKASKPAALLLLAEPAGHVKKDAFEMELKQAGEAGFFISERPAIPHSNALLLRKI